MASSSEFGLELSFYKLPFALLFLILLPSFLICKRKVVWVSCSYAASCPPTPSTPPLMSLLCLGWPETWKSLESVCIGLTGWAALDTQQQTGTGPGNLCHPTAVLNLIPDSRSGYSPAIPILLAWSTAVPLVSLYLAILTIYFHFLHLQCLPIFFLFLALSLIQALYHSPGELANDQPTHS